MSRKNITGSTVVVDIDGELIVWTDGLISGPQNLVTAAKLMATISLPVELTPAGPTVVAELSDASNPAGALAALLGASAGRGRILSAPTEVLELLPFDDADDDDIAWLIHENTLAANKTSEEQYVQR